MSIKKLMYFLLLSLTLTAAISAQTNTSQLSAPIPQNGSISGLAVDADDAAIPDATVILQGPVETDRYTTKTTGDGSFALGGLKPTVEYKVVISEKGFADWTTTLTLLPGEAMYVPGVKLKVADVVTAVSAESPEQIATEQVHSEETQRLFGVVPNFFVVYDPNPQPLTVKLKYQLSIKAATDVVTLGGAVFVGAMYQAAYTPTYREGAAGFGQRIGAEYAGAVSDVLIGGAVLPSLLHQDPRYFYDGKGTKKSRALHAISAPFICRGDNGKQEFNFSSIGGDLASGALSELYYPQQDRGTSLVFTGAAITTAGRMLNALAQEFVLRKLTHGAPAQY
jgi:hypothetical protein